MYRGQVTAVDSNGVYALIPALHPTSAFGPLDHVGAQPAVGARVLVADCGDDESAPDLVVMTGSGPATSTDNAVARFDGTGGALQDSGVTVDDSGNVDAPGYVRANAVIAQNAASNTDIELRAHSGYWRSVYFKTDVSGDMQYRFIVGVTNDAESGSHAGSNFFIARWGDGWTNFGYPIKINRATGRITLGDVGSTAGLEFGSSGPRDMSGAGSPEGVVTAPKGSTWRRTDGGAGTTFWVKESGTGNTGWVAK